MNKYVVLMIIDVVVVTLMVSAMAYIALLPGGDPIGNIIFYVISLPIAADRMKSFTMVWSFYREERLKAGNKK